VEPGDFVILEALLAAFLFVRQALSAARVSVARLKRLFFGPQSEKSKDVLDTPSEDAASNAEEGKDEAKRKGKRKPPREGHGRLGVDAYPGAIKIAVHDDRFSKGCPCPDKYCTGKLYVMTDPIKILRIVGQAALMGKIWEQDRWRCNLCEQIHYARLPPEAQAKEKYDPSAVAMIGLLHFGNGFAYHRLATHQQDLGIPVPASDQSELLKKGRTQLLPVFNELRRRAAQVDLLHNDDTRNKVLALMKKPDPSKNPPSGDTGERTGIYTTAIVAITPAYKIALYATGRKHAGENLTDLLQLRAPELSPPTHMSDGLDHNRPAEGIETDEGKCLTHGRRQFVDIASSFPEESRYVIEALREVYRVDALAKKQALSPVDRLFLHQGKSGPVMDRLRRWLVDQFLEKNVEPNSSLGQAIKYLLKRWEALTLFLRKPGAPLDNNVAERVLKLAIRHRRNSLFFKTTGGAQERSDGVGDVFTSFIATCQLNGANPFDYLTTLLRNAGKLAANPGAWLPWNYKAARNGQPTVTATSTVENSVPATAMPVLHPVATACSQPSAAPT
jgi:hypothetical protein